MLSVQRLSARACLDESAAALRQAKAHAAEGDESWEQWVLEYERGDALILRLDLTMEMSADGVGDVIEVSNRGLFVENHVHAPRVEKQIAELASGDFASLAADLALRRSDVDPYEVGELYVHVELEEDVRRRLTDGAP